MSEYIEKVTILTIEYGVGGGIQKNLSIPHPPHPNCIHLEYQNHCIGTQDLSHDISSQHP